ncbi:flagellar motor switch protein FliG [Gammaproteobacteria bacterium AS21]|jgi:flagellar motor switch protein FliG
MSDAEVELTDIEKAAILLISLGEDDAAEVLRHLGPKEVQQIGVAMSQLDNIAQTSVESVISEFIDLVSDQTGIGIHNDKYIRRMLNQALGDEKAKTLIDRILLNTNTSGLDTLRWMEPLQVAELIRYEHPQIQAVVVSYIDPDQAASVLSYFDDKVRLDIILRIASLDRIQPAALQELNDMLEQQFSGGSAQSSRNLGGIKQTSDIMNYIDSSLEEEVMGGIKEVDEELADKISDMMFVFENLIDIDDRGIQVMMREIQTDQLVIALKGADATMQDKIFRNMSKRAADLLRDELEAKGPVRMSDVEEAQKGILAIARKLADSGEIMLGGGDDMV